MSRFIKTEAAVLLAAFVVLIVGAGALANRYVDPSAEILQRSAEAARKQGTYRFTTAQRYSGKYAGNVGFATGIRLTGAVDITHHLSRFDTTIQLPGVTATCTYLNIGDALYVSVHPSRQRELGASWLRTKSTGVLASATLQGFRPDELNTKAADLFNHLKEDGTVVVRGVRATRYTGSIDVSALAGGAVDKAASAVGRTLPVEVDVDRNDLLRRIAIEIRSNGGLSVRFTTDLFDYGKPLAIPQPPEASVRAANARDIALACYPTTFPVRKS